MPPNEVVDCHIHEQVQELVQIYLFLFFFFLGIDLRFDSFFQMLEESLHITSEYLT